MKIKQTSLRSASGAGETISTQDAGFLPGMQVAALIGSPSNAFVGTAVIQTSVDGTTWATATGAANVTAPGLNVQTITLAQFIRINVTAYTSGNIQATFLSDID